jgi:hypothetical protein
MSKFADPRFWVDTIDRAIATFAQAALGAMGAGTVGLIAVEWGAVLSVAGFAALVSVLTSIALRAPRGDTEQNRIDGRYPII